MEMVQIIWSRMKSFKTHASSPDLKIRRETESVTSFHLERVDISLALWLLGKVKSQNPQFEKNWWTFS